MGQTWACPRVVFLWEGRLSRPQAGNGASLLRSGGSAAP